MARVQSNHDRICDPIDPASSLLSRVVEGQGSVRFERPAPAVRVTSCLAGFRWGCQGCAAEGGAEGGEVSLMAQAPRPRPFGELEAAIMDVFWTTNESRVVREVVADLQPQRPLAYTTVMTVMDNLH